ncbi:MAG: hypothetical protein HY925_16445 [Elusimicrobia bacterium]|nr:hypothetical protein [Elusimicrobiota bacterium]
MSPASGLAVEIAAAYFMLFTLSALGALNGMRPVWVRKLAHACTSLLALSYPAVLRDNWAVAAMCGVILAHLAVIRAWPPANSKFGVILGGLERDSWGDLFLPVAIGATYYLSGGDRIQFTVPILIIGLADPAAALVGERWGRLRYKTFEGTKTVEGSAAFFAVAFVCAIAALGFATEPVRGQDLVLAAVLGAIVTLVECVTWRGIDNLTVPLAGWFILYMSRGADWRL